MFSLRFYYITIIGIILLSTLPFYEANAQIQLNILSGIRLESKIKAFPINSAAVSVATPISGSAELSLFLRDYYLKFSKVYYSWGAGVNFDKSLSGSHGQEASQLGFFLEGRIGYDNERLGGFRIYGIVQSGLSKIWTQNYFSDTIIFAAVTLRHPTTANYHTSNTFGRLVSFGVGVGMEWNGFLLHLNAKLPASFNSDAFYDRVNSAGTVVFPNNSIKLNLENETRIQVKIGYTFKFIGEE